MQQVKQFHIGDAISVATEKCVFTPSVEGFMDLVSFMTGESVTHLGLLEASPLCKSGFN